MKLSEVEKMAIKWAHQRKDLIKREQRQFEAMQPQYALANELQDLALALEKKSKRR